jgi:hypothetical protein
MSRKKQAAATARAEQIRRQIEHWRKTRSKRGRMPEPLWEAAVELAREQGVYATSQSLRVNYDSLRSRVQGRAPTRSGGSRAGATFVELGAAFPLGAPLAAGVVLELSGSKGQKLTLRLPGLDGVDVAGLARALWGRRA